MIFPLPLLCVAITKETVACEPNRQDKKAQPCWVDQPDLLYGGFSTYRCANRKSQISYQDMVQKFNCPQEPVIVRLPKPPATYHKPVITPRSSEPANPWKRALARLQLQIDADLIDMNEAGLIIMQTGQAQKPGLLKAGTGW